jgi:DNA-binding NtrC family response regulator
MNTGLVVGLNPLLPVLVAEFSDVSVRHVAHIGLAPEALDPITPEWLIWGASGKALLDGEDILDIVRESYPDLPIFVVQTDSSSLRDRYQLSGCIYIHDPVDAHLQNQLLLSVRARRRKKVAGIIGESPAIQSVIEQLSEAAYSDISVLITGETGTGKDVAAQAIHRLSPRATGPYVVVNTGAMPTELIAAELFGYESGAFTGAAESREGRFEQANGGTLFLDEIGTMDQKAQVILLRLLETKSFHRLGGKRRMSVDVRVVAATNEDLEEAILEKRFREDLFFRFDVFRIHLPPLRERAGDIPLLTKHFVLEFSKKYQKTVTMDPRTLAILCDYPWPGNIRELKHVIQRAVLLCKSSVLTPDYLSGRLLDYQPSFRDEGQVSFPVGRSMAAVERGYIEATIRACHGHLGKAATVLGMSRKTIYNKRLGWQAESET